MRLISAIVRNYRIHQEQVVEFDPRLTLVGGPNESGKSTLIEAVHRALFLKARISGEVQQGMVSKRHVANPEVEVRFNAGGAEYVVAKKFSGATGSTRLTQAGGGSWQGEEAEERLARLLKVQSIGGGRGVGDRIAQQWSHLWVWQGQSGGDPSEHASQQKEGLIHRLQQSGGAAALQSQLDSALARHFGGLAVAIFTQAGKPKAGSDLDRAVRELEDANESHRMALERVSRLRDAVAEFERTGREIKLTSEALAGLNDQSAANELALKKVAELERQIADRQREAGDAAARHEAAMLADSKIRQMRQEIQRLEADLEPGLRQSEVLSVKIGAAKMQVQNERESLDRAGERTRDLRLRRDLAANVESRFERDARLAELHGRQARVDALRNEMKLAGEKLARLPEVSPSRLKKLQKLNLDLAAAGAALNAIAAEIEVLAVADVVRVGQSLLKSGERQTVTEATEIELGESLKLRIHPGGGSGLRTAREQERQLRQDLASELESIGLPDVASVIAKDQERRDLLGRIEAFENELKNLDAARLPAALEEASRLVATAVAEIERRSAQLAGIEIPADPHRAVAWRIELDQSLGATEAAESKARAQRDAADAILKDLEQAMAGHEAEINRKRSALEAGRTRLELLIQTHGPDEMRASAISALAASLQIAQTRLKETQEMLEQLQPRFLSSDQERLARARKASEENLRELEKRNAVAGAALRFDGAEDPESSLSAAAAGRERALENLETVQRKADAIALLNRLFTEEQRALSQHFTQPFADRISAYLQCLFGPGTRATVSLEEHGFSGLQLVRGTQGAGADSFETLSGGAREQVAAAVRLAMAEVLAADHDNCLPLVFDDAFAYSDPERVLVLQRMLDHAASRGLQIILLSCNPSDYSGLGARQVTLAPTRI